MRRVMVALGMVTTALPGGAGAVAAAASPVSPAFGNTILSTYPDGRTAEIWLNPDGSYTGQGRRHDPSSGHWKVSGGKLCFKQSRPFPVPFSDCFPLPSGGIARPWAGKAPSGEATRIQIKPGRVVG
ncbi:MAG: hypothetical protein ACR2F8_12790 [Caulobacteraceae bacterium]